MGLSERIEEQETRPWRDKNHGKISSREDDLEFQTTVLQQEEIRRRPYKFIHRHLFY